MQLNIKRCKWHRCCWYQIQNNKNIILNLHGCCVHNFCCWLFSNWCQNFHQIIHLQAVTWMKLALCVLYALSCKCDCYTSTLPSEITHQQYQLFNITSQMWFWLFIIRWGDLKEMIHWWKTYLHCRKSHQITFFFFCF